MKTRALPKSCSCLTPLYRGELFAIDDWCCDGSDSPGKQTQWCADDRVVFTRSGVWSLQSGGRTHIGDPLQAMLWNGNSEFRVRHPIGGADDCTVLRLTPAGANALRALGNDADAQASKPLFALACQTLSTRSFGLHWRLLNWARQPVPDRFAIEQSALDLLVETSTGDSQSPEDPPSATATHLAQCAREVIAKHYREALSLSVIASQVGCSPFYLARQFKRCMGMSLHQALIAWRLRVGLERVLDQPEQLASIALDLGFASHSHFTDAFKASYGVSPSGMRMPRRPNPLSPVLRQTVRTNLQNHFDV